MSTDASEALALARDMHEASTTVARETIAGMSEVGKGLSALAAEAREGRLEREGCAKDRKDVLAALEAARPLLRELGRLQEDAIEERIEEHGATRYRDGIAEGRRQVEEEASIKLAIRRSTARAIANPLIAAAIAGLIAAVLLACAHEVYTSTGTPPPHIEGAG